MAGRARDISTLLATRDRNADTESELFDLVRQRFQVIADRLLKNERAGHSMQPTMLVDDAFLQLIRARDQTWHSRQEFFSHAARIMRSMLVDHARARVAVKRGGGDRPVALHAVGEPTDAVNPHAVVELDDVLQRLEMQHPDVFRVFDLHYFMQYELQEIADDILDVSYTTVRRRWKMARAFLHRELAGEENR